MLSVNADISIWDVCVVLALKDVNSWFTIRQFKLEWEEWLRPFVDTKDVVWLGNSPYTMKDGCLQRTQFQVSFIVQPTSWSRWCVTHVTLVNGWNQIRLFQASTESTQSVVRCVSVFAFFSCNSSVNSDYFDKCSELSVSMGGTCGVPSGTRGGQCLTTLLAPVSHFQSQPNNGF